MNLNQVLSWGKLESTGAWNHRENIWNEPEWSTFSFHIFVCKDGYHPHYFHFICHCNFQLPLLLLACAILVLELPIYIGSESNHKPYDSTCKSKAQAKHHLFQSIEGTTSKWCLLNEGYNEVTPSPDISAVCWRGYLYATLDVQGSRERTNTECPNITIIQQ